MENNITHVDQLCPDSQKVINRILAKVMIRELNKRQAEKESAASLADKPDM